MRIHLDEWKYDLYRPEHTYAARQHLDFELRQWGMSYRDRQCMEREALDEPYVPGTPSEPSVWTAAQLNGYAATCDIDLSELYVDMDRPGFMED